MTSFATDGRTNATRRAGRFLCVHKDAKRKEDKAAAAREDGRPEEKAADR
jgi:hypothetical protein